MATVITAEPLRGGGILVRPSVNGLQFVEAEPLRGGGILKDTPIGSYTNVHNVLGWTPADNSEGHEIAGPVTVNFEAENTNEHDVDFTDGGEYNENGTHNGTVALTTGIELDTDAPNVNFDDYTLNSGIDAAGQPDEWQWLGGTAAWKWVVRSNAWSWDGQHIDILTGNGGSWTGFIDGGNLWAATYSLDVYHDSTGGTSGPTMGIGHQLTGSGTALRGYIAEFGTGQYCSLKRVYSSTYHFGVQSINWGTMAEDTLYHVKFKFVNNGVTTWLYAKRWIDGAAEPADFTYVAGDTAYANRAGITGLYHKSGVGNYRSLVDNFKIEPDPAVYNSSGDWQSEQLDVSPTETLASSRIYFDLTTPEDTSAAVKCRWGLGDDWLTCTAGEKLPGIDYRADMRAGAARALLELKIELATTDTSVTPAVDNLEIAFRPCDMGDVAIDVAGNEANQANGHLATWGENAVSAGATVRAYDDLYAQAHTLINYLLHGEAIIASFNYSGAELDSIVYAQLLQAFALGRDANGYFGFTGASGAREASGVFNWTARDEWTIIGKTYHWVLIDKGQGIHANGWYWVGHQQLDDFPGSVIVGHPEQADFPGSVIVEGLKRFDFPGSLLVQGWRLDDFPGSVLPAVIHAADFPGSVIVGVGHHEDFPGSVVVFGVNRNNKIEIHAITDDTKAALEAAGYVFPAEAT